MLRFMAWLKPIGVGVASLVVTSVILGQFPGHQPGIESHYHYKMGQKIANGDLRPNPGDHLPLSVLASDHPVDHHFGFHLLIAPFAGYGSLIADHEVAMKLTSIVFVVLAVLALFWLLVQVNAPAPELLCFVPSVFGMVFWRNIQLRGGTLMAIGLVGLVYLAFVQERWRRLLVASYALMLCYHGAFLALPVIFATPLGIFAWEFLFRGVVDRSAFRPTLTVGLGLLFALVVSPYGIEAFEFLFFHLHTAFGDPRGHYQSGHEFSPFSAAMLANFFEYVLIPIGLVVVGVGLWKNRAIAPRSLLGPFFATVALVVLTWRSHRLVEYSVPMFVFTYGSYLGSLRGAERLKVIRMSAGLSVVFTILLFTHVGQSWSLMTRGAILVALGIGVVPLILRGARPAVLALLVALFITVTGHRNLSEMVNFSRTHGTPTTLYAGAKETFRANPGVIGNLYQSDFSLILWEDHDAECVQGLNYYFIDGSDPLHQALARLKQKRPYDPARDDQELSSALRVLWERGVRVVTQRTHLASGFPRPLIHFADRNPKILERAWAHPDDKVRVWVLRPEGEQNP